MDAKVYELINDQINKELYSAYLYLSFADYYEEEGLSGYANYFEIQAQEERDHAMIFRNYLHENGEAVKLLAIDMPDKTFANFLEPLEAAMEHEKYVTPRSSTTSMPPRSRPTTTAPRSSSAGSSTSSWRKRTTPTP